MDAHCSVNRSSLTVHALSYSPSKRHLSPQPQRQARSIKSLSQLFCSFYKLWICTVGNSGFLANNHRVNTALQIENKMPETSSNALTHQQQSAQSEENTRVPFHFKNVWKYVQLWYSFGVLRTPMATSCKPLTISRALWETTIWSWSNFVIKPNEGNNHTSNTRCVNHALPTLRYSQGDR
jgi:hypothetical protein